MKEFGAFLPMSRAAVEYARENSAKVEQTVKDFVLLCDPQATDIRILFHVWDANDPAGQEMARRQFHLPLGTAGTIGWKCLTPTLGHVTS